MPVNFWHHHAEDEHMEAMHHHNKAAQHHCELDDYFCDVTQNANCPHPEHIATTLAKCFGCEFSFVKHYTFPTKIILDAQCILQKELAPNYQANLCGVIIYKFNKGPPCV